MNPTSHLHVDNCLVLNHSEHNEFFKKVLPSLSAIHKDKSKLFKLTWGKKTKTIKLLKSGITKLPCVFPQLRTFILDICHPKKWLLAIALQGSHRDM